MEYNYDIKNMGEVKEAFPGIFNNYINFPYISMVEKFKKDELRPLLATASHRRKITEAEEKQLEGIAEVRAVYRFCWGWNQIIYNMAAHRIPAKYCNHQIQGMLRMKVDPWACDSETVTDYMNRRTQRNPGWGMYTDKQALRDIDYND